MPQHLGRDERRAQAETQDGVPLLRPCFQRQGEQVTSCPSTASSSGSSFCFRCGSPEHWANFPGCPARLQHCFKCGKTGRNSKVCRSPGISAPVKEV
ncbi:hypothetical protein HPB50_014870 [Hyalomma asiaticum]|uniref:Uncharacterized protein n=1 Tax=Hyalomma asiaticum TaxID=266040 RepID=A0ACB7TKT3_HYAAI|nr:hypothetical protein HPB50_014870 [Hyalomma asiaticum]